jgi:ABC-type glycerol-3-phosphate transport system substrate-binding protein
MADVAVDLGTISSLDTAIAEAHPRLAGAMKPGAEVLGLPMSFVWLNGLVYDLDVIATPPSTHQDYYDLCDAYVTGGSVGPKPLGMSTIAADPRAYLILMLGWIPADVLFEQVADPYPALEAFFDLSQHYLDSDCIATAGDLNASGSSWDEAVQLVADGNAMLGMNADWARGYLVANGLVPGTDFGAASALGTGAYIYTAEFMVANADSPRSEQVNNFMEVVGSLSSQLSFAQYRGTIPGLTIDNPTTQISDAGTLSNKQAFDAAEASNRIGPMRPWIASGTKPGNYLKPFFEGTMTKADAIMGYLCGDGAAYTGYACP